MTSGDDLRARLDFAVRIAREAGDATLDLFGTMRDVAELKADGSEVTAADRAAEETLRARIEAAYPGDGVLGEEFGTATSETGWRWIIDPIDGTFSFVRGVPLYATLLACERLGPDGAPVDGGVRVGVIHMPGLRETVYAARGLGAWWAEGDGDPKPARVSAVDRIDRAAACVTSPGYFDSADLGGAFDRLRASGVHLRGWSDAYAAVLLATGRCEAMIEASLKPWDVAPIQPIIAEAGGRATDWSAQENVHRPTLLASNGAVHDELLTILTGG